MHGRNDEPRVGTRREGVHMAEQASERKRIEAPPERCFAVAADFERYPEWARDVKEAVVVERDAEGRGRRAAYRAGAMGHSVRYTLRYDYHRQPLGISWALEEGDIVRRLDGEYVFEPAAGDCDATDVTYRLSVELAVPLPGFVKRRAEGKIVSTALDELQRRVESEAAAHPPGSPE
jgi:ribosome-associated toxin RatA of RatAB toxin-antitoxin module